MQKACGGVGDVKKADAKIQGIVDNVLLNFIKINELF